MNNELHIHEEPNPDDLANNPFDEEFQTTEYVIDRQVMLANGMSPEEADAATERLERLNEQARQQMEQAVRKAA